jgi:hypothetical protein
MRFEPVNYSISPWGRLAACERHGDARRPAAVSGASYYFYTPMVTPSGWYAPDYLPIQLSTH